jgi:O-succinylbenzoic acid--CoA ligase
MTGESKHLSLQQSNAAAIVTTNMVLSYAELLQQSKTVRDNIIGLGFVPGQRICLLGINSPEYVVLLFGLWRAGMVAVPLSIRWPARMIEDALIETGSSGLIEILPEKRVNKSDSMTIMNGFDLLRYGKKIETKPSNVKLIFHSEQDATILFTSGSSKKPKAVLHSFANHYYSALGSAANIPFSEGDRWLLSLPLYHIGGMAILFRMLLGNAAVVIHSSALGLKNALQKYHMTHISLVSTQLQQLMREPENISRLRGLKAILLGGGPLSESLIEQALREELPIYYSYGSTEMSSQITATGKNDKYPELRTAGCVLPYREIAISDETEVLVRGNTLFRGYISGDTLDAARDGSGWFHSGDLGYLDDQGYLTIAGRKDNMFISGGENIQPEELELAIMQIEGIEQVLVVPVDHPEYGKRPVAFIKIQDDNIPNSRRQEYEIQEDKSAKFKIGSPKLSEDRVSRFKKYLEKQLPKFKIPDYFFSWPEQEKSDQGMKSNRQSFQKIANNIISEILPPTH